jgi:hypothetical protein
MECNPRRSIFLPSTSNTGFSAYRIMELDLGLQ